MVVCLGRRKVTVGGREKRGGRRSGLRCGRGCGSEQRRRARPVERRLGRGKYGQRRSWGKGAVGVRAGGSRARSGSEGAAKTAGRASVISSGSRVAGGSDGCFSPAAGPDPRPLPRLDPTLPCCRAMSTDAATPTAVSPEASKPGQAQPFQAPSSRSLRPGLTLLPPLPAQTPTRSSSTSSRTHAQSRSCGCSRSLVSTTASITGAARCVPAARAGLAAGPKRCIDLTPRLPCRSVLPVP